MEEILITEEELDYFITIPDAVYEPAVPYRTKKNSFEEEAKKHKCITLEELGRRWKESIDNDPRFV